MRRLAIVVSSVSALLLGVVVAAAPATAGPIETGVDNPVTAAPAPTTPATPHCTVTLARHFLSNGPDDAPQNYAGTLRPPAACPGPWAKVLLDQTISVSGRQFDRSAGLVVGGVQVYFGTTAEPSGATPTTYRVTTDVTDYQAVFRTPQPFTGGIVNYRDATYTGNFDQTVSLTFFRATAAVPAAPSATVVRGQAATDVNGGSPSTTLALPALPRNIVRAELLLSVKGNGCDEQWFDAVPDALVTAHPDAGLCGGGPFRQTSVALDGTRVAAVHTYPYLYTGGIVPTLWKPVPAIGTFSFTPERVDLTPFAADLVDGATHSLRFTLDGARDTWQIIPTLLLWTDPGRARTSGAVTRVAVAAPSPTTTVAGDRATVVDARTDTTSGWLTTSTGRVTTTVVRTDAYRNVSTLTDDGLTEAVRQTDHGGQTVTSSGGSQPPQVAHTWSYPIDVDVSAALYVDDQNFSLSGHVRMGRITVDNDGRAADARSGAETVDASGVLARTDGVTSTSDGSSTSTYTGTDDAGRFGQRRIVTAHGQIVSDTAP